jgi:aspartate aminotransferase
VTVPPLFPHYAHTILVASFSKDLGLAGERIGYLAVHPDFAGADAVSAGIIFCLRTLGFVNAPALMQLAAADVLDASVDVAAYQQNRDFLYEGLTNLGYEVVRPEGAFYLFPKSPLADDREFVARLQRELVLAVPGCGFGRAGHFRLSYAVESDVIHRALPRFHKALHQVDGEPPHD